MRACYLPDVDLVEGQDVLIKDERFHHLVQVCRIRLNDEILILNGQGKKAIAIASSVTKRDLSLLIQKVEVATKPQSLDALIAVPKKDALELILKMSIELGLRNLFLIRSEYSQERIPDNTRLNSLIHSAIEQSNNPWPARITVLKNWDELPWEDYEHLICFDPRGSTKSDLNFSKDDSILTLVGPEGGFSNDEIKYLQTKSTCHMIAWSTPILRAPTAFSVGVGWVTARTR